MKTVLLVDDSAVGHHLSYIRGIAGIDSDTIHLAALAPKGFEISEIEVFESRWAPVHRNFLRYGMWLREIHDTAVKINADIIHFVNADALRPFFGVGLELFTQATMGTFHNVQHSFIREASLTRNLNGLDVALVHARFLATHFRYISDTSVKIVDYPSFEIEAADRENVFNDIGWGLDKGKLTIACLGATRMNKGIDILLRALQRVDMPFNLLIAGQETGVSEALIRELSDSYKDSIYLHLSHLSENELVSAVWSADYLALPYRKTHNGISGPLALGVAAKKGIIGPDHGSLGTVITDNHLGYVFETEDIASLANAINRALVSKFEYDEVANAYRNRLTVSNFRRNMLDLYESL